MFPKNKKILIKITADSRDFVFSPVAEKINDDNKSLHNTRNNSAEIVWIGWGEMEATRAKQTIFQFALNILLVVNRKKKMVLGWWEGM